MKRTLIAACVAVGIVAFNAAEAQAAAIQFDASNIAGNIWQYSYSVTDIVFGANQALFIDFDSDLFSNLQDPPISPNADWSTFTFPTSVRSPGFFGQLPPGSFVALSLVDGASLADPFTVTFTWLGANGTTPGLQPFTVYQVDGVGNVLGVIAAGNTQSVPEPATLGLMAIGIALAGGRALRRRRNP